MKSEYQYRFWLRVAEATRAGWACLLAAAVVLYVPKFQSIFPIPVLAPVLAIILAGPSLGTVLKNSWGIMTVVIPALMSTTAVLKVLRPPISEFATIACTGVTSFLVAYLSETHILGRKIAIAQTAVVYITARYTPDMNAVIFPLTVLATDGVGVVMAIIATLIPIPRLAIWEVRKSAKSAARGSSELLNALVKTLCESDPSSFGSMHLHAKVLAKGSADTLTDLKKKQADFWWELGACGRLHVNKRLTKGLDCLNLHLQGMEMALESGYVLYTPAPLRGVLQGTLPKVVDQCKPLLDFAVKGLPRFSSTSIDRRSRQKDIIEDGRKTLNLLDTAYRAAREQAYYTPSPKKPSSELDAEPWPDYYRTSSTSSPDVSLIKREFRGRVSMLFFVFNLRLYLLESINLVSAGHSSANKMHQLARIGHSVTGLEQAMAMQDQSSKTESKSKPVNAEQAMAMHDQSSKTESKSKPVNAEHAMAMQDQSSKTESKSKPVNAEQAMAMHDQSSKTENKCKPLDAKIDSPERTVNGSRSGPDFLRPDDPSLTASRRFSSGRISPVTGESTVSRQSSHRVTVFIEVPLPQAPGSEAAEGAKETGLPSGNGNQGSGHGQCRHRNAGAMEKVIKAGGGGDAGTWKLLRKLGLKPSKTQTMRSLKTALEMILATIFGNLVLKGQTHAFWAPVTVGFIIGNFQGGTWRISILRLQGTVLGSIYGFLALSASNNHRWAELLLLVPWVIFTSFIRYSPAYGYSGLVAAFTAAILMLGGFQDNIKDFALGRITETFVGILCFVFVETVIFPERAVVLVRRELLSSLVSLRDCVGVIVSVYTEQELQECQNCRSLAVTEIKQLEQRLRVSFEKQSVLSKEAALEPDLWFVPFPANVYSKIIAIQGRMLDLLYFMICSLHATTEDCASEQMETLLKPLRTSLTAMQEEVVASLDFLQEVLQVKHVQGGKFHRLKLWLGRRSNGSSRTSGNGGDVEQQLPRSNPNSPQPHHPLLVLGRRHRSVDGIPTTLKTIMDSCELSFVEVFEDLIATTNAEEGKHMLSNTVMLSVGSLTFSLHALLKETVHLEKAVHELLQAENPWSVLDFWDNYLTGVFQSTSQAGRQEQRHL